MGHILESALNPEDESGMFQKSVFTYKITWCQNPEHYSLNMYISESYIWQQTDGTILTGRNANAPKENAVSCSLLISCCRKLHCDPLFLYSYNSVMNSLMYV
jgi:hypothetical protein